MTTKDLEGIGVNARLGELRDLAVAYSHRGYRNPTRPFDLTRLRDEIVEILPHTFLGRGAFKDKSGTWAHAGYFVCLRSVDFVED